MISAVFFLFFSNRIFAELLELPNPNEIEKAFERSKIEEYQINSKLVAGSNLIYDCQNKHYACVNRSSLNLCQELRDQSYRIQDKNLSCAIIEKFDDKEKCLLKNYDLQNRIIKTKFCDNELLDGFEH